MRNCRECGGPFEPTETQRRRWDWLCPVCQRDKDTLRSAVAQVERALDRSRYAMTSEEIAEELGISARRVNKIIQNAMVKMRKEAEKMLEKDEDEVRLEPKRYRLPESRTGVTHKFDVGGTRCYLTVNCYADGAPGEVFLKYGKLGGAEHGWTDAFSIAFSMLLQNGVPLRALTAKFRATRFEPAGVTSNRDIGIATSVLDYAMRWMELKYLKEGK